MTSRYQKEERRWLLLRGEATIPEGRFERSSPNSRGFVWCTVCHAKGLGISNPTPRDLSTWQIDHCFEHTAPCRCGLVFLNSDHLRRHVRDDTYPWRALEHGSPNSD